MRWRTHLRSLTEQIRRIVNGCGSPTHSTARSFHPSQDPEVGPTAGPLTVTDTANGRWLVDAHGRTVVLHGVNVGLKCPPFLPSSEQFTPADAKQIRSWGFNVVRLGVMWEGIAPSPNDCNDAYLARLRELTRLLIEYDIHVLIDFHQDLYSRDFAGGGAPSWAVCDDGLAFQPTSPWPLDYAAPAVMRAFDHFWLDDYDLHAAYGDAVRAVALCVATEPAVIGYDLFNEPMPGSRTVVGFERQWLPKFYNRIIRALRDVDESTPVWVEPLPLSAIGIPSSLRDIQAEQLVYSFHNYATGLEIVNPFADRCTRLRQLQQQLVMHNSQQTADRLHAVPVLTEFCPGDRYQDTARIADFADRYMVGWIYWAYKNWGTRTSGTAGTMASHTAVVDALVRPYPPAIAGVPQRYSFDYDMRRFELVYTPVQTADRPTVIFVPHRHYPAGCDISIDGGAVTSTAGQYVRLDHHPSTTRVDVVLTPA